jgi:hypothetical protein
VESDRHRACHGFQQDLWTVVLPYPLQIRSKTVYRCLKPQC